MRKCKHISKCLHLFDTIQYTHNVKYWTPNILIAYKNEKCRDHNEIVLSSYKIYDQDVVIQYNN